MITPKSFTIVAALLAGGTTSAIAQNGLPTGGEPPVAGGANGNPLTPGFDQAPGAYIEQPGYVEWGTAPARVHRVHHRTYSRAQ